MKSAIVVGTGPNGLAAALHLVRQGVDVHVIEASDEIGGGARSAELTEPGLIHDTCSAFHPMGVGSHFWKEVGLTDHGLRWLWPEVDCAHPLDDGPAGLLHRSITTTADGLGRDGKAWKALFSGLSRNFEDLAEDFLQPIINIPNHPLTLARFGPRLLPPSTWVARAFRTPQARALYGGVAAHVYTPLNRPLTSSLGMMMIAGGHRYGWPVAEGGSGSISTAIASALTDAGGTITTGVRVRSVADIPDGDVVMLDVSPQQMLDIYGNRIPARIRSAYRRYRTGSAAFKVDFAIRGDIPWTDPNCASAGTVHLGGTYEEISHTETLRARGTMAEKPFVLVGQQYVADPSRSNGDLNPIYAYAHVPAGYAGDATAAIINQIERFAPGFRDIVVSTSVTSVDGLERHNPNYAGGDIIGGANDGLQLLFRPRFTMDPYATGIDGVYICSQSTPPGAGVHGLCGYNAAQSALRHLRSSAR